MERLSLNQTSGVGRASEDRSAGWRCDNENCTASQTQVRLVSGDGSAERADVVRCYCGGTLRRAA